MAAGAVEVAAGAVEVAADAAVGAAAEELDENSGCGSGGGGGAGRCTKVLAIRSKLDLRAGPGCLSWHAKVRGKTLWQRSRSRRCVTRILTSLRAESIVRLLPACTAAIAATLDCCIRW